MASFLRRSNGAIYLAIFSKHESKVIISQGFYWFEALAFRYTHTLSCPNLVEGVLKCINHLRAQRVKPCSMPDLSKPLLMAASLRHGCAWEGISCLLRSSSTSTKSGTGQQKAQDTPKPGPTYWWPVRFSH